MRSSSGGMPTADTMPARLVWWAWFASAFQLSTQVCAAEADASAVIVVATAAGGREERHRQQHG